MKQEPSKPSNQKYQPDLQRFRRKQRGDLTSRLPTVQVLRQQAQQQGFRTRQKGVDALGSIGEFITWYKGLNRERKIALASISLLLLLIFGIGVFAIAGGFKSAPGQANGNSPSSNDSQTPISSLTATSAPTSTSAPTATATPQDTPTDQSANGAQPTDTTAPTPTDTPPPAATDTPTPAATTTSTPTQ